MELVFFAAIAVLFWLLLIRPAQRRQKEIAAVQAALAPGESVVLTSGIVGTVTATEDAHVMLEVAPGVVIKVARAAVGSVLREDADDETVSDEQETVSDEPEPGSDERGTGSEHRADVRDEEDR